MWTTQISAIAASSASTGQGTSGTTRTGCTVRSGPSVSAAAISTRRVLTAHTREVPVAITRASAGRAGPPRRIATRADARCIPVLRIRGWGEMGRSGPVAVGPALTTPRLTAPRLPAPGLAVPDRGRPALAAPRLAAPRLPGPGLPAPGRAAPGLAVPGAARPRLAGRLQRGHGAAVERRALHVLLSGERHAVVDHVDRAARLLQRAGAVRLRPALRRRPQRRCRGG